MRPIAGETQRPEETKRTAAGRIWLRYYNRTLFEKGLITARERDRMALKINGWTGKSRTRQRENGP